MRTVECYVLHSKVIHRPTGFLVLNEGETVEVPEDLVDGLIEEGVLEGGDETDDDAGTTASVEAVPAQSATPVRRAAPRKLAKKPVARRAARKPDAVPAADNGSQGGGGDAGSHGDAPPAD